MSVTRYKPSHRSLSSTSRSYDVFLSFRGEDVRRTFLGYLLAAFKDAGVDAFLDSHDIKRGDMISSTIRKAIDNSEILIPIFSKNFAASHWCLDEVAHMCKANGIIIPLFYYVKPTEVRNPWRGAYAEAFEGKKQRYTPERISEWAIALHEIPSSSGWCIDDTSGSEAEKVKQVVQDVLEILKQKSTSVEETQPQSLEGEHSDTTPRNEPLRISKSIFINMAEHVSKVINMLNTDSDENVLTVAIYGDGGVGKTSLAKAIHSHIYLKFDATCFVYDVRHKAQNTNGVAKMQRQLLKDLVKFKDKVNDEVHGKMLMKTHLRSIKALVILEYVDDWKQLEALRGDWFGPGSRVLVTTLDPNILKNEKGSFVYELQGLAQEHALQLFSWHAFMRDEPEDDYKELSSKAVDICNRLPFSLEVLGAHLRNRDLSDWNQTIQTLECSSYNGKYAIPRLCYDGLKSEQKEMFLDMACLFTGRRWESVISFWEASHLHPNVGLTEMKLKSLIKLDDNDRLGMHSELRDTGRAIVADESAEPGNRSRLFKPEEVQLVLTEEKGTERVRYLTYLQQDVKLQTHSFQRMCELHLLWLNAAHLEGDYRKMPPNLKWLRWENCPLKCLPCEWNMKHVVVLDLSFSKSIKALWLKSSNVEGPKNLKVLKLNYCTSLQVLPDLASHTSLMQLELCGCKELKELPESIGFLTELKCLDLSNCCSLKNLPESVRWLSCLEKLSLHGCHNLRSLPQPIGEWKRLRHLDLHCCSRLQTLPDSIYELESLSGLDMTGCKEISLEEGLGHLVRMERLVLSNCAAIWRLPISTGQLNYLRHLNLNHCTFLSRLPKALGNLICLEELLLNECYNLHKLPKSIGNLSCLKTLEMEETYSLYVLPDSFSELTSLKNLKVGGCPLPELIGELSSLENMHLKSYRESFLPPTFGSLLRLTKLFLHHCTQFVELPRLPKELIEVCIQDCFGLEKIFNMSHMKRLKLLRIHNCRELVELPDLGFLQSLQELSISECKNLKPIHGIQGLKSLRRVHVPGCRLTSSGSSILKPRLLIKETRCLELLSFSANGVPKCLEKKMEINGDDVLYATLDSDEQCSGIAMSIMVRFRRGINSVGVELSTLRDDKEIFNTRLVNHSKNVEGDQIFVHILHKNHPMVMILQSGDVVRAKADRDEERMIRSGGMQFLSKGEDGRREDLLLENLGRDLAMLMETYRDNLAFEDEE
ncbi:hypothetical protein SUGI_0367950 [Cryptomeria japonica]|uniref:disease resistance protein RUN1 n=1 Tax=Cryptomeria japonica TaxID=3369 RepID=UPI002408B855|nr:disease resistance protein RUN1 [Cryptomeria japonica]GLJ20262.1 hypothetical protein SUGI_0367950 [Cryptomeria japonica]